MGTPLSLPFATFSAQFMSPASIAFSWPRIIRHAGSFIFTGRNGARNFRIDFGRHDARRRLPSFPVHCRLAMTSGYSVAFDKRLRRLSYRPSPHAHYIQYMLAFYFIIFAEPFFRTAYFTRSISAEYRRGHASYSSMPPPRIPPASL